MTFYRKYRPQTFAQVLGQPQVIAPISRAIAAGQPAHAYLFAGPRGTGKTSVARLVAKALNCLNRAEGSAEPCNECENCLAISKGAFLDVIEIDAASQTGVDNMRELTEQAAILPASGKFKVYILDEVHMLSTSSFNALLKTLEEPPAHVVFILCTTESHKVPVTVASRCQRLAFSRAATAQLVEQLQHVAQAENIAIEDNALQLIANLADGGYRDAAMLLEQVAAATGERGEGRKEKDADTSPDSSLEPKTQNLKPGSITAAHIEAQLGLASQQVIDQIFTDLTTNQTGQLIRHIEDFAVAGGNVRQLTDGLLDMCRQLLVTSAIENGETKMPQQQLLDIAHGLLEARQKLQHYQGVHQSLALQTSLLQALQGTESGKGRGEREASSTAPTSNTSPSPAPSPIQSASSVQRPASRTADSSPTTASPATKPPASQNTATPTSNSNSNSNSNTNTGTNTPSLDSSSNSDSTTSPDSNLETRNSQLSPQTSPQPTEDQPTPSPPTAPPQELQAIWLKALDLIRPQSRSVEALLRDCLPLSFDGTILVLQFWYEFHKKKLEMDKNRHMVEEAMAQIVGHHVKVQCELGDKATRPKKKPMGEEDIKNVEHVDEEDLLEAAVDIFGGEVVE